MDSSDDAWSHDVIEESDCDPIDRLVARFLDGRQRGETISPSMFAKAYPEYREELERLLELACNLDEATERTSSDEDSRASAVCPPKRLGDFEVRGELGRGGMGIVYEVWQISLSRRCAIKILPPHLSGNPTIVERFHREARSAAKLRHESIIEIHATGESDGFHYFVMEKIEGHSLDLQIARHRNEQRKPRSRSELALICSMMVKVARALDHAHQSGIVHRDIKPSNIMIRLDGSPVITDFGLALAIDLPSLTRTGDVTGTPCYASPEQARGGKSPLDHRSDIFSLGATLYELLTLERPFSGETSREVLFAVENTEVRDPRHVNDIIDADLAAILLQSLEKDPKRRYTSAAALADDLEAYANGRPVEARLPSTIDRLIKWVRREPLRASLLLLLIATVPTVGTLSYNLHRQAPKVARHDNQLAREDRERDLSEAFFMMEEEPNAALGRLENILRKDPKELGALVGLCLLGLDDPNARSRNEQLLRDTEALIGKSRVIDRLRAATLDRFGEFKKAREIYAELGEPTESLELFVTAQLVEESNTQRTQGSAELLDLYARSVLRSKKPRAFLLVGWAKAALVARNDEHRRLAADALAEHFQELPEAWMMIGWCLRDKDQKRAAEAFRRAVSMKRSISTLSSLALFLARFGQADEGIALAQEAATMSPEHASDLLAEVLLYAGKSTDAVTVLEEFVDGVPPGKVYPNTYRDLAQAYILCDRVEDAAQLASVALEHHPASPVILEMAARVHSVRGDHEAALPILTHWVEIEPESWNAWYEFAACNLAIDDRDAVRDAIEEALLIDSVYLDTYLLLAKLQLADEDPQGAFATLNKALEVPRRAYYVQTDAEAKSLLSRLSR